MKKLKKNRFGVPVYSLTKKSYYTLTSLRSSIDRLLKYNEDGDITEQLLKTCLWDINHYSKVLKDIKILKSSSIMPNSGLTHTIYNFGHSGKNVTIYSDINNNITFDVSDFDPHVLPF